MRRVVGFLRPEHYEWLKRHLENTGAGQSTVVRRAVLDYLKKYAVDDESDR